MGVRDSDDNERVQVDLAVERLAPAGVGSRQAVAAVVEAAYTRLSDTRIRDYIPLLVERRARRDLGQR